MERHRQLNDDPMDRLLRIRVADPHPRYQPWHLRAIPDPDPEYENRRQERIRELRRRLMERRRECLNPANPEGLIRIVGGDNYRGNYDPVVFPIPNRADQQPPPGPLAVDQQPPGGPPVVNQRPPQDYRAPYGNNCMNPNRYQGMYGVPGPRGQYGVAPPRVKLQTRRWDDPWNQRPNPEIPPPQNNALQLPPPRMQPLHVYRPQQPANHPTLLENLQHLSNSMTMRREHMDRVRQFMAQSRDDRLRLANIINDPPRDVQEPQIRVQPPLPRPPVNPVAQPGTAPAQQPAPARPDGGGGAQQRMLPDTRIRLAMLTMHRFIDMISKAERQNKPDFLLYRRLYVSLNRFKAKLKHRSPALMEQLDDVIRRFNRLTENSEILKKYRVELIQAGVPGPPEKVDDDAQAGPSNRPDEGGDTSPESDDYKDNFKFDD
jgi:hypothetical protein